MNENNMKTIILTGANSGIGKEAAIILARQGHRLLLLNRESEKSRTALAAVQDASGSDRVDLFPVDLAEPAQIRETAAAIRAQYPVIDVLVNNAGVFNTKREVNGDGVEVNLAVHLLAPYLLTTLLEEELAASGDGRVINVVSELYKQGRINLDNLQITQGYKGMNAYANSKLACVLWTKEAAAQLAERGIMVNAFHPGTLATAVFRDYPRFVSWFLNLFLEKAEKGGERIAYLATAPEIADVTGVYFMKLKPQKIESADDTRETRAELVRVAAELTRQRS